VCEERGERRVYQSDEAADYETSSIIRPEDDAENVVSSAAIISARMSRIGWFFHLISRDFFCVWREV
jgi:hypothetical protein